MCKYLVFLAVLGSLGIASEYSSSSESFYSDHDHRDDQFQTKVTLRSFIKEQTDNAIANAVLNGQVWATPENEIGGKKVKDSFGEINSLIEARYRQSSAFYLLTQSIRDYRALTNANYNWLLSAAVIQVAGDKILENKQAPDPSYEKLFPEAEKLIKSVAGDQINSSELTKAKHDVLLWLKTVDAFGTLSKAFSASANVIEKAGYARLDQHHELFESDLFRDLKPEKAQKLKEFIQTNSCSVDEAKAAYDVLSHSMKAVIDLTQSMNPDFVKLHLRDRMAVLVPGDVLSEYMEEAGMSLQSMEEFNRDSEWSSFRGIIGEKLLYDTADTSPYVIQWGFYDLTQNFLIEYLSKMGNERSIGKILDAWSKPLEFYLMEGVAPKFDSLDEFVEAVANSAVQCFISEDRGPAINFERALKNAPYFTREFISFLSGEEIALKVMRCISAEYDEIYKMYGELDNELKSINAKYNASLESSQYDFDQRGREQALNEKKEALDEWAKKYARVHSGGSDFWGDCMECAYYGMLSILKSHNNNYEEIRDIVKDYIAISIRHSTFSNVHNYYRYDNFEKINVMDECRLFSCSIRDVLEHIQKTFVSRSYEDLLFDTVSDIARMVDQDVDTVKPFVADVFKEMLSEAGLPEDFFLKGDWA